MFVFGGVYYIDINIDTVLYIFILAYMLYIYIYTHHLEVDG